RQLGARPLIVCMPFDGVYSDFRGASALTRSAFYDRLRAVAEAFHVPLIDFASHEYDKHFFNDLQNHPSPIGQLYYDWVINAFYHQTLIQPDGTLLNPDRVLLSNKLESNSHVW
ncbi:MAG TPA: D-alanyl-lipoteichoic acid biosynthesis protein DltD, partial [Anaerolineae bacterium]|nr:D-alanyl-lipoteichoic acid biosynthesis protein DltD [Anaerolineae bacterium]